MSKSFIRAHTPSAMLLLERTSKYTLTERNDAKESETLMICNAIVETNAY